jgi:hypothetical protein
MEIPQKHNIRNCIHCNKRMSCNLEYDYDAQTGLYVINVRPYHERCKTAVMELHKKALEVEALELTIKEKKEELMRAGWNAFSLK